MENKILDLTKMDDESFKIVKTAVEDMANNGTKYIIDKDKNVTRFFNMSFVILGSDICHLFSYKQHIA